MTGVTYRTLETPSGSGEVSKDGERIAGVYYRLEVRQEIEVIEAPSGNEKVPGRLDIAGEIIVDPAERMKTDVMNTLASGQVFTLHLADSRELPLSVFPVDQLSGIYRVACAIPSGFVRPSRV